mmetsp:Transcript_40315/g.104525  ORF Transcript_40315/g.104525 Transcript_40315/m.104525 type:complete len:217 (+) Transcript_40315:3359-4009(+)
MLTLPDPGTASGNTTPSLCWVHSEVGSAFIAMLVDTNTAGCCPTTSNSFCIPSEYVPAVMLLPPLPLLVIDTEVMVVTLMLYHPSLSADSEKRREVGELVMSALPASSPCLTCMGADWVAVAEGVPLLISPPSSFTTAKPLPTSIEDDAVALTDCPSDTLTLPLKSRVADTPPEKVSPIRAKRGSFDCNERGFDTVSFVSAEACSTVGEEVVRTDR